MLAVIDAARGARRGGTGWRWPALASGSSSPTAADELTERIEGLILEYADKPDDEDGSRYGLYLNLHRLR